MRAHLRKYFIICAAVLLLTAWGTSVRALDPPHIPPEVTCRGCHANGNWLNGSGGNIDNTPMNLLCLYCHKNTPGIENAVTHSSTELGDSVIWSYECRECHNPHLQEQTRNNRGAYKNDGTGGSWLASGAIQDVTAIGGVYNVITLENTYNDNVWVGYTFVGNTTYNMMYRIANSTGYTLTVETPTSAGVLQAYVKIGSPYAITYGKLFKSKINTRKIIANSGPDLVFGTSDDIKYGLNGTSGDTDDNITVRDVKFLNGTDGNSLVDNILDKQAVCVVCHTRTKFMNIGYAIKGNAFDNTTADYFATYANGGHADNISAGVTQCWTNDGCHVTHEKSFKGGATCGDCHGAILDGLDKNDNPDVTADLVINKQVGGSLVPVTTGSPSVWAHPTHYKRGAKACALCHEGGMNPGDEQDIGDDMLEIQFSGYAAGGSYSMRDTSTLNGYTYNGTSVGGLTTAPGFTGDGNMTCTSVYCHSDGGNFQGTQTLYTSPNWNDTAYTRPTDCNKCHGDATHYVKTDRHLTHTGGGAGEYSYNCEECHSDTVDSSLNIKIDGSFVTPHVNNVKDVVFGAPGALSTKDSPSAGYGGSLPGGNGTCSSVYCHSNANPLTPSGPAGYTYADAIWGDSGMGCGYCHSKQSDPVPTWSAPHTMHVKDYSAYTNRFYCDDCHSGIAAPNSYSGIADTSLHVDGIKNVVLAGGGTYDSVTHECTNVACHDTGYNANNPFWNDTLPPTLGCGYCHGTAKDMTTMQSEGKLSPVHFEHIANALGGDNYGSIANRLTQAITCDLCHKGTTDDGLSINTGGLMANHVDLSPTVDFDFTAINTTAPPAYGATCSVYCHGSAMPHDSNSGTNPGTGLTPSWSDTNYITGNYSVDCNRCHGSPPAGYTSPITGQASTHGGTETFKDCHGCHSNVYQTNDAANGWIQNGTAFEDISLHINGIVEGVACNGCHGQPPLNTANDPILGVGSSSFAEATQREGQNGWSAAGAHATHNDAGFGNNNCDKCHKGGGKGLDGHPNSMHINMGFTHVLTQGTYSAPQFPNANFSDVQTAPTVVNYPSGSTRTCDNIYCHSDAGPTTPVYASPNWDDSFSYPTDCDQCHGDGLGTGNYVQTSKHPKHVGGGAGQYTYTCEECHTLTTDETMTRASLNTSLHVNGQKDVDFGTDSAINDDGSWATNQCSSTYCHSYGDKNAAPYNGPVTTADWGGSMPGDCTGCHGNDDTTANPMGTVGSAPHTAHINNPTVVGKKITCPECHAATASTNQSLVATTYHVNHTVNVKFDNNINPDSYGPAYNSQSTAAASGGTAAPGSGASCNNVYCHSDGNTNGGATPSFVNLAWSGTLNDCGVCHGASGTRAHQSPDANVGNQKGGNSHVKHVENSKISCEKCHSATTDDTTAWPAMPTTVLASGSHLDGQESVSFSQGGSFNADGSCSSTYCHGAAASPSWGDNTTPLLCTACHASQGPDSGTFTGAHAAHTDIAGGKYDLACENCHATMDSTTNTEHAGGPGPGSQTAEVEFPDVTPSGTTTYGTGPESFRYMDIDTNPFGGVYTSNYSPGGSAAGTDGTKTWTAGTCTVWCHSNANPLGGSFTPTSPTWASVGGLNCDACHAATGSSATHTKHVDNNTNDFKCNECHDLTTDSSELISSAAMRDVHVNGVKNVVWMTGGVNDGSTNYTSPNCSIYCHSNGTSLSAASPDFTGSTAAVWGNTFTAPSCDDCHTGGTTAGPTYANGSLKENSHDKHVVGWGFDCEDCHSTVIDVDGTSMIYPNSTHLNQAYDVVAGGTYTFTYSQGNPGSCSSISCHGGKNANWGATLACTDCHGVTSNETEDFGTGTAASINDLSVTATIDTGEFDTTGHGLDSGNLPSGNPAPNLLSGATNKCLACHDDTVNHEDNTNPFRLRSVATVNQVCLNCHDTDSGTAPGVSGFRKPTQAYIGDVHYNTGGGQNARHDATTYNGGRFCWDCHDPHGTPSNTFMMGQGPSQRLTRRTTATGGDTDLGIPYGGTSSTGDTSSFGRTASVTFTATRGNEAGSDFVRADLTYSNDKFCETCHDGGSSLPHYGYNVTQDDHNSGQKCIQCHTHVNGFIGVGGDCKSCHSGAAGSRRTNVVGEFSKYSHHVAPTFNGGTPTTLSAADCVVCHLEGDPNGDSPTVNSTFHLYAPGPVNLRNADNSSDTSLTYNRLDGLTDAEHNNRDNHCMSCHDSDGATDANAKTQASERVAYVSVDGSNPFGDDLTNAYDQLTRPNVINIYDKFNPGSIDGSKNPLNSPYDGNAAHHAVRGRRYSQSGTQYLKQVVGTTGQYLLTDSHLLLENQTSVTDSSILSCGDCHTGGDTAIGIHGSNNEYLLRQTTGTGGDVQQTWDSTDAGLMSDGPDSANLATLVCFYCHTSDRYYTKDTADGGYLHAGNSGDFQSAIGLTGTNRSAGATTGPPVFGYTCSECHNGGQPATDASIPDAFGGIHGANYTYTGAGGSGTSGLKTYRFMPGVSNWGYDPINWDQANIGSGNCYTWGMNNSGQWTGCEKHGTGTTPPSTKRHVQRPISY